MTSRIPVGDSHNFGRRVSVAGDRIHKPRANLWEWLVLGADSPVRKVLREVAEQDGLGRDAFGFLPELKFFPSKARDGGAVERIALEPLPALSGERRSALAGIVGRSLALFSWLGVSDLHWENLVLGVGDHGEIIFAPLDIEMILGDLALPTQTKLLPDADPEVAAICRHACGVRRVLPYLGKPVAAATLMATASAYTATLALLERHARRVADVLAGLGALRETPIRVCLRGTDEYIRARSEPAWPPLLDAEAEQLARGDIPYFFRLYGRPGIHYYANPALTLVKRIPIRGDVPQVDPLLSVSRGLRSPMRKKLCEEGLFALLGAFDHPSIDGRHEVDKLAVTFRARSLLVELPAGVHLRSRRNLRAFVGSVYLPCRCGEVRSVLVPPVTACKAFS
jgi:hypothetical protein